MEGTFKWTAECLLNNNNKILKERGVPVMRKRNKAKFKSVAWLLTICMVATMLPFAVFAEDYPIDNFNYLSEMRELRSHEEGST